MTCRASLSVCDVLIVVDKLIVAEDEDFPAAEALTAKAMVIAEDKSAIRSSDEWSGVISVSFVFMGRQFLKAEVGSAQL